jgi:aryl-alcohol dehydrogenase-like predicted oxidoreductase
LESATWRSRLHGIPRFTPEARKTNQVLVELAQRPWIVPIPGTWRLERLDENIGAVAVDLTSDDLHEIDSAASEITVQGARYPEHLELLSAEWLNRDF